MIQDGGAIALPVSAHVWFEGFVFKQDGALLRPPSAACAAATQRGGCGALYHLGV